MKHLYRAPSAEENVVGDRVFSYLAEIDILGWKFRKLVDGSLVIETPSVPDIGPLLCRLGEDETEMLEILAAMPKPEGPVWLPPSEWSNVGSIG